jgi:DNA-binding MarR family transcriptional regulator
MTYPEPPSWDPSLREVGLVALQAAVLTRRIFLPAVRPEDFTPEQWQMLLALALTDTAPDEYPAATAESLTAQLSLDRDLVHEVLFELARAGLLVAVEEDDADAPLFRLSQRGWEAARAYTERAGRFLPGWPPQWRLRPAER